MKIENFLFKKRSASAKTVQIIWWEMGSGCYAAHLPPVGSVTQPWNADVKTGGRLPGTGDEFCYLNLNLYYASHTLFGSENRKRKTEDKTRTPER